MDLSDWGLYLFLAAALLVAAALYYRRREPAGRGRGLLAALRGAALALLLLLLFDPEVPHAGHAAGPVVLLDGSLSMRLPREDGVRRWDAAVSAVLGIPSERIVLFGDGDGRPVRDLAAAEPDAPRTRLAPALRGALETSGGPVVVITDGAVEDAAEVRRLVGEAGGRVIIRQVGGDAANAGVGDVDAPAWMETGEEAVVRATVVGAGPPAVDSLDVLLVRDDSVVARARIEAPPRGGEATAALRFTPGRASPEPVALHVVLDGGDVEPADDRRTVYVRITDRPAGVTLVSFRPDQEPRFLLPVLERALGLPVQGWLALPGGRFIRLGTGSEAGRVEAEDVVRGAVARAELRVLHGLHDDAPGWASPAGSGPALVFPAAEGRWPVAVGAAEPGDWYVTAEPPPSPVADLLAGVSAGEAPPLVALRMVDPAAGAWAPLTARLQRRGPARPVVVAVPRAGAPVAVALGEGYWRWAFEGGAARDLYERLWSAVGGWLLRGGGAMPDRGVAPRSRVVERGAALEWLAPRGADSLRVTLHPLEETVGGRGEEPVQRPVDRPRPRGGAAALDTAVAVADGVARTAPLPPGRYRFEIRAWRAAGGAGEDGAADRSVAAGEDATGAGELTVESYSPEFTDPAVPLVPGVPGTDGARGGVGEAEARAPGVQGGAVERGAVARPTRPLRTLPWPYIAIVALLCAEWILRRRWGLR